MTLYNLHMEEYLDISIIHSECSGTPDAWLLDRPNDHLHIWDYKYGHSYVDVFENWQLLEYASGIYAKESSLQKITMTVVQPRCYSSESHTRSWTITRDQLLEYIEILQRAEKLALSSAAPQRPGSQCNYCPGRHACQTLQQTALAVVDVSMDNTPWDLSSLSTGNELRYLKHAAELLDARITGLSEQARSMITRGELVPGFKLESSQGRERWLKTPEEIITMGELLGFKLAKPAEAITPVQAKKLGMDLSLIEHFSQRIPGALKLVETKDGRKIFGGNK
jgi:hypothetical protein